MVVLPDRTVVPPAVSNEWHRRGRSTVFYREHQLLRQLNARGSSLTAVFVKLLNLLNGVHDELLCRPHVDLRVVAGDRENLLFNGVQ